MDKGGVKEGGRENQALRTVRAKRETDEAGKLSSFLPLCDPTHRSQTRTTERECTGWRLYVYEEQRFWKAVTK